MNKKRSYKIVVLKSFSQLEIVRELWQKEQNDPLVDFEFFKLIVNVRNNINSPCIFVVLENEKAITILLGRIESSKFPVKIGYATLTNFSIRQLVLIGNGYMGHKSLQIWKKLVKKVKDFSEKDRIDIIKFEQMKIDSNEYKYVADNFNITKIKKFLNPSKHWILDLPKTWDDFLINRKRKHRYWLKRLPRVLEKDFNNKVEIRKYSKSSEFLEFLKASEKIAKKTYHRRLGVGYFLNNETKKRVELDALRGMLRGYVLYIDKEPKSFWHCTLYKNVLHLISTGYDPNTRKYELGTILLMKVFKDIIEDNIRIVNFGLGDSGYKERFGTFYFEENTINIFSNRFKGVLLKIVYLFNLITSYYGKKLLTGLGIVQKFKTNWRHLLEKKITG